MKRFFKTLGVLLCVTLFFMTGVSMVRAHEEDVTAPVLHYVDFAPITEIDTTSGGQDVTVTAHVTDDLSGVLNVMVKFLSPSGHPVWASLFLTSGDSHDGLWTGIATFPQYSEQGMWTLEQYAVNDVLWNSGGGGGSEFYPEHNIYLWNVIRNDPPLAEAGSDQTVILGETVYFDGSGSSDTDGTIVSYEWDFGDSTTGSGVTTTHEYATVGIYTVTLTVTDNDEAIATDTLVVTIQTPQEAIDALLADVDELSLPPLRKGLLKVELNLALRFLDRGRIPAAKASLYTFILHVRNLERLGFLSGETASGLVASAQAIIGSI